MFDADGKDPPSPWEELKQQIYLVSDAFVEAMQRKVGGNRRLSEILKRQRRLLPQSLSWYFEQYQGRDKAIFEAFRSGGYNMREIADHVGVHYSRISRIIRQAEKARDKT